VPFRNTLGAPVETPTFAWPSFVWDIEIHQALGTSALLNDTVSVPEASSLCPDSVSNECRFARGRACARGLPIGPLPFWIDGANAVAMLAANPPAVLRLQY